jgi:lipopolysaccharide export system protein LptC
MSGNTAALSSKSNPEVGHGLAAVWQRPPEPNSARSRPQDDRHSRRVALLKGFLPALGTSLLMLVVFWPRVVPLLETVRSSFPIIDFREARELRMLNPRYAGVDRFNRPFVVTSAIGRQAPNRDDLMSLESPRAQITLHSGAAVVVTAATAMYQSQAQLLDLFGDVNLVHENGTRFVTKTARVDVAADTAEGSDPVSGHGPSGDITAQGFRISEKGNTILFTGKSNLRLKGTKPSSTVASPPTLPVEVEEAAARIDASANAALTAPDTAASNNPIPDLVRGEALAKPDIVVRSRTTAKRYGQSPPPASPTPTKARQDAG